MNLLHHDCTWHFRAKIGSGVGIEFGVRYYLRAARWVRKCLQSLPLVKSLLFLITFARTSQRHHALLAMLTGRSGTFSSKPPSPVQGAHPLAPAPYPDLRSGFRKRMGPITLPTEFRKAVRAAISS